MRYFFVSILIFFSLYCVAQVDSLMSVLENQSGEDKINTLNQLSVALKKQDPDKSFNYAKEALTLSEELNDVEGESNAYYNMGVANYYQSNFDDAVKYYSLALEKKRVLHDSVYEAKLLYNIGMIFHNQGKYEKAVDYYQKSLKIEEKISNKPSIAKIYNAVGIINMNWENFQAATDYYSQALAIYKDIGDRVGEANVSMNIGLNFFNSVKINESEEEKNLPDSIVRERRRVYEKAINNYQASLAIYKEMNYLPGISLVANNMGAVYKRLGEFDKAIEYTKLSVVTSEKIGNQRSLALAYGTLGVLYFKKKDYDKAREYNDKSIRLAKKLGLVKVEMEANKAYMEIFIKSGDFEKALKHHRRYTSLKDSVFTDETQKQFTEMQTKYETDKLKQEKEAEAVQRKISDEKAEETERANNMFKIIIAIVLVFSVVMIWLFLKVRKVNRELEYKNAQIEQAKEEIEAQAEQLQLVNTELEKLSIVASETDNSVIIADKDGRIEWVNEGFIRLMGYSFDEFIAKHGNNMITNSANENISKAIEDSINAGTSAVYTSQATTKSGKEIWLQTTLTPILGDDGQLSKLVAIDSDISKIKEAEAEIMKQRDLISDQRQEILDSIHYAKRIQTAIMPRTGLIENNVSDFFVLYKPRDIVSGDFYWLAQKGNNTVIAAADCTGHGVPGAFMSMLGVSFLNEIVNKKRLQTETKYNEVLSASDILDSLRDSVINSLHQTGATGEQKDGMDIALCIYNSSTMQMQFAGANNPVYIIDSNMNNESDELDCLTEIKGDKMPIGIYHSEDLPPFSNNEIQLKDGQSVYIFSDGYPDQFGGPKGKKFKYKPFKRLLVSLQEETFNKQKEVLDREIEDWKGDHEQVDDILVIGFKS